MQLPWPNMLLPLELPRSCLPKTCECLYKPSHPFPSVHYCTDLEVMGRRFSLGLGKDFEPVFPSQQLFPNAFPVVTTSSQIWIDGGDVMSPWKGKFVPVRLWYSWGHWETPVGDCDHLGDYVRWSQRGIMFLRVDPNPGTQPVLCVMGNTAHHHMFSWSEVSASSCSKGKVLLCNKTPGLPAVVCGVTWLWDELWKFPTASVVSFSTKKHS